MTDCTPTQARELANTPLHKSIEPLRNAVRSLANQVEALTAERETFLAAGRVLSKVTQEFIELTAERDVLSAVVASYERVGIVSHDGMNAKVGWTKPVRHNTMLFAVKDPK